MIRNSEIETLIGVEMKICQFWFVHSKKMEYIDSDCTMIRKSWPKRYETLWLFSGKTIFDGNRFLFSESPPPSQCCSFMFPVLPKWQLQCKSPDQHWYWREGGMHHHIKQQRYHNFEKCLITFGQDCCSFEKVLTPIRVSDNFRTLTDQWQIHQRGGCLTDWC